MPTVLDEADWQARRDAHVARVDRWTSDRLARRREGRKHPVDDFLFDYYAFRPGQLRQWHPGFGVVLTGSTADAYLRSPHYERTDDGVTARAADLAPRVERWRWTRELLTRTANRPASFGCFGLHEWAMVYRLPESDVRHAGWPLRLTPDVVAQVVEEQGLRCSHFDAFRFFTPDAAPLNVTTPTADRRLEQEQPGCLHATMDLYKWAFTLHPFVASELVADCFELAREVRSLDMRASPYDLRLLDQRPVPVETAEGRAVYVAEQRGFAERGAILRVRLVAAISRLLDAAPVSRASAGVSA